MNRQIWLVCGAALVMILNACSTAKVNVMPGEDGVNRVVVRDIERDDAEEEAVKAANKYCQKRNQEAVFLKDNKTQYTGSMDESTRKNVRNASKVATVLGSGVGVMGSESDTRTAGAVVGTAGTVGYGMTNDRDYQTEMHFKCK